MWGGTTIPTNTLQHEERTNSSVGSHSSRGKKLGILGDICDPGLRKMFPVFSDWHLSIVHLEFSYINVWFDASDTACCVSKFNIPDFSLLSSFLPSDSSSILMMRRWRSS